MTDYLCPFRDCFCEAHGFPLQPNCIRSVAGNRKYSPDVWHILEVGPRLVALLNPKRELELVSATPRLLIDHYLARPAYVPRPKPLPALDLSTLRITL